MRRYACLIAMLAACTVESGKDVPLPTGEGAVTIDPATQAVKLDTTKVPVLAACAAGQIVRRTANGWECIAKVPWASVDAPPLAPLSHTHPTSEITGFSTHTHPTSEITGFSTHTHSAAQVTDFAAAVGSLLGGAQGLAVGGDVSVAGDVRIAGETFQEQTERALDQVADMSTDQWLRVGALQPPVDALLRIEWDGSCKLSVCGGRGRVVLRVTDGGTDVAHKLFRVESVHMVKDQVFSRARIAQAGGAFFLDLFVPANITPGLVTVRVLESWGGMALTMPAYAPASATRAEIRFGTSVDYLIGNEDTDALVRFKADTRFGCRAGFWALGDGRLCMESAMRPAAPMYDAAGPVSGAIRVCQGAGPGGRVCTFTDFRQACGAGFNPYGGVAPGWYGDHAVITAPALGNWDDEFGTWNYTLCDVNNDGPAAESSVVMPFRCCY